MKRRHVNRGVEKRCGCLRSNWSKCKHPWRFRHKPPGQPRQQFSLDKLLGRHIDSKTQADAEADTLRTQMDNRTFRWTAPPPNAAGATLAVVVDTFLDRMYPKGKDQQRANVSSMLKRLCAFVVQDHAADRPIGTWPVATINEDILEKFFESMMTFEAGTRTKYAQTIRRFFQWALRKQYLTVLPISDETTIKGQGKAHQRRRRVYPDEEERLLAAASPFLRRIIIAAIDSCCRIGELLALKRKHVNRKDGTLFIAAEEEGAKKTSKSRQIPIQGRMAMILDELAKETPEAIDQDSYVFGNEIGERVKSIKKSWETCVLKAHSHKPVWTRRKNSNALAPESRAALEAIDLHFHDLRHEGGNRLLEAGWYLHEIQLMLGHETVTQTATYLHADEFVLRDVRRRLTARGPLVVHSWVVDTATTEQNSYKSL